VWNRKSIVLKTLNPKPWASFVGIGRKSECRGCMVSCRCCWSLQQTIKYAASTNTGLMVLLTEKILYYSAQFFFMDSRSSWLADMDVSNTPSLFWQIQWQQNICNKMMRDFDPRFSQLTYLPLVEQHKADSDTLFLYFLLGPVKGGTQPPLLLKGPSIIWRKTVLHQCLYRPFTC
jgi:hypothetical protein